MNRAVAWVALSALCAACSAGGAGVNGGGDGGGTRAVRDAGVGADAGAGAAGDGGHGRGTGPDAGVADGGGKAGPRDAGLLPAEDGAELVDFELPSTMVCGRPVNARVRLRNIGTATWRNLPDDLGWKLGLQGPAPPLTLRGWLRFYLGTDVEVPPGQEYDFQFTLTAPREAGAHRLRFQMVHEQVRWFGPIVEHDVVVTGDDCPATFDADCPRTRSELLGAVDEAIAYVESEHPEYFYFDAGFAGGAYALRDQIGYTYAVVRRLNAGGLIAIVDAWAADEISVKRDESFSENFDIVIAGTERYRGGFVRRGSGAYRATCTPSYF